MLNSMFQIMVCGISGEILKTLQKSGDNKNASRIDIFKKLKD
jgi:hypothetical protein